MFFFYLGCFLLIPFKPFCFRFWSNQNSDCSICVRVCPYNRDFSKPIARAWRWLAGTPLRKVALWLADRFAPGSRVDPGDWWTSGRSE